MIRWLKRLIAGRELAELERWRVECSQAERWLNESDDARHALQYVRAKAEGAECEDIAWVRDRLRQRHVTISVKFHTHSAIKAANPAPATDWDVAQAEEQPAPMPPLYMYGVTGEEDA